jgi:hypothetical protein
MKVKRLFGLQLCICMVLTLLLTLKLADVTTEKAYGFAYEIDGFVYDGPLDGSPGSVEVWHYGYTIQHITIPETVVYDNITYTVTNIAHNAFIEDSTLTSISLPDTLTYIGEMAFFHCTGLTDINIPDGVTYIGVGAFEGCSGLTSINIPYGVTIINDGTFSYCRGLTNINLPDSVISIYNGAFWDCSGLTSISISKNLTSIYRDAFDGCSSLTSINIPDKVTSIGRNAFSGCSSLTSITFSGSAPPSFGIDYYYPGSFDVFTGVPDGLQVFVPKGAGTAYGMVLEGILPTGSVISEMEGVDLPDITGVTAPIRGAIPVTTITETPQYTGTVTWAPADQTFAASTVYTATITLTPKNGYTLTGVTKDFFTVAGATSVSNDADSSVITATFPTTADLSIIPPAPQPTYVAPTETPANNNIASVVISDQTVTDAIAKAVTQAKSEAQAKEQNKIAHGTGVALNVPMSLKLDLEALKEILRQSSGNVTISFTPVFNLSKAAKNLTGTRPVYNITVTYVKDGETVNITSLGNGSATLSISYKPRTKESVGYLFGVYVDGEGNASRIPDSAYEANSDGIILSSNHLSIYGVGYTTPSAKFTDISTHWAKESIDYVVGRGLISGTSDTTFSPDTVISRAVLVTALGRLAGVDVSGYKISSFTDVKADSNFLPYIEWAYKNGIIKGTGNQQFAPDRAVTREEIAVILQNYAKVTGYTLPVTREEVTFADAYTISSHCKDAVKALQQAGIMSSKNNSCFYPKGLATRAEFAAILHRYIKLTIDPTTTEGWAKNDSGRPIYYRDGKAFKGGLVFREYTRFVNPIRAIYYIKR